MQHSEFEASVNYTIRLSGEKKKAAHVVVCICNPSMQEVDTGRLPEFRGSLNCIVEPVPKTKSHGL